MVTIFFKSDQIKYTHTLGRSSRTPVKFQGQVEFQVIAVLLGYQVSFSMFS